MANTIGASGKESEYRYMGTMSNRSRRQEERRLRSHDEIMGDSFPAEYLQQDVKSLIRVIREHLQSMQHG